MKRPQGEEKMGKREREKLGRVGRREEPYDYNHMRSHKVELPS